MTADYGSNHAFTITPNTGYHITSVTIDNGTPTTFTGQTTKTFSHTFSNGTAAHSIAATFAIDTFEITVTQAANGSISPVTLNANYGSNHTFTVTPNAGYHITSVTIDGTTQNFTG